MKLTSYETPYAVVSSHLRCRAINMYVINISTK